MKVSQIMTKKVITTDPYTSAASAFMQMMENGFRHLPVVGQDDDIWGIVSLSDLRESLHLRQGQKELSFVHFEGGQLVKDLLRAKTVVVDENTDVKEVARMMVKRKIGALPVIRKRDGKLVGIVTESDILTIFVEFMSHISDSNEVCLNMPGTQNYLDKALKDLKTTGAEVLGVSMSKGQKRGTKDYLFRVQTPDLSQLKNRLSKKGYHILKLA